MKQNAEVNTELKYGLSKKYYRILLTIIHTEATDPERE